MKTNPRFPIATRRGFSLIEVLIAVLVLSVGLLALGALQASLVRSSTESKARSVALAIAEQQLEGMRTFSSVDTPGYADIDDAEDTVAHDQLGDVTVGVAVERFGFDRVSGQFVAVDNNSDPLSDFNGASGAAPQFVNGQEFKRVTVEASWVASDGDKSVVISDIISSVNPEGSARVMAKPVQSSGRPQVLYRDPSMEAGVIPIAIGDGTDTAATNPRPEVAGRNNNSRVIETRFDVLTYQGQGDNTALVQSRVETVVVGCTCQETATQDPSYRPAYWNGARYTRPQPSGSNAPARHVSLGNNDPPESPYCTECCRDHHDAGFTGAKFSPRWDSHEHTVVGGRYLEACRLIRVDGIFAVAADLYNDHFSLLATQSDFADPVPAEAAAGSYEDFVLDYLGARAVTGTSYNSLPSQGQVDNWEATNGLNDPETVQIRAAGDTKWLHARGLYVDYLEPSAVTAINNAKTQCNTELTSIQACVLQHLPFTSINLTELSTWEPASGTSIVVSNNDFRQSLTSEQPVRGRVSSISASPGSTLEATGGIANSNGGVALLYDPVNGETTLEDAQGFQVIGEGGGGTDPGGGNQTGVFTAQISGYPFSNAANKIPQLLMSPTGVCSHATSGNTKPNPYNCSSSNLGGAVNLTVGNYNYQTSRSASAAGASCTNASDSTDVRSLPSTQTYTANVCVNYEIQSATVGAVAGQVGTPVPSDGVMAETTTIQFGMVAPNDALTLTFGLQGETVMGIASCTFTTKGQGGSQFNKITITSAACP